MSKNKNNTPNNSKNTNDHYKLKTDAVNRLVNADKMEIPKDPKLIDPGKKYRSGFLDKIPNAVKVLFIKFWFNGAICYFIFWGLGIYIGNMFDMLFVMSVVLGAVTDIMVNNVLRFIENVPGQNSRWMIFSKKKFWTFFTNIIYSFVVLYCVASFYDGINILINVISGTEGRIYLGVEPLLFGIFYLGFDLIFIGIKNMFLKIFNDAKNKVENNL